MEEFELPPIEDWDCSRCRETDPSWVRPFVVEAPNVQMHWCSRPGIEAGWVWSIDGKELNLGVESLGKLIYKIRKERGMYGDTGESGTNA